MLIAPHWFAGALAAPLFTLAALAVTTPRPVALTRRRRSDDGRRAGPSAVRPGHG